MTPPKSQLAPGVDVPWVTSWTSETVRGIGPCETVGGRLALRQDEQPGFGKPQYSMNHLRRQRLTVGGMLCPMCGRPTQEGDRWTQTAKRTTAGALREKGMTSLPPALPDRQTLVDAGSIAPLHRDCVRTSLRRCPFLKGHDEIDVQPFPKRWAIWPLYVEGRAVSASLLSASQPAVAVVTFLQLIGMV